METCWASVLVAACCRHVKAYSVARRTAKQIWLAPEYDTGTSIRLPHAMLAAGETVEHGSARRRKFAVGYALRPMLQAEVDDLRSLVQVRRQSLWALEAAQANGDLVVDELTLNLLRTIGDIDRQHPRAVETGKSKASNQLSERQ